MACELAKHVSGGLDLVLSRELLVDDSPMMHVHGTVTRIDDQISTAVEPTAPAGAAVGET